MKILRIVIALVLTVAMLYIARRTSRGHPEEFAATDHGFTLKMTTVPKAPELDRVRIDVNVSGPLTPDMRPVLRLARSDQGQSLTSLDEFSSIPLVLADSTKGDYFTQLSTGPRGEKIAYYFEVKDEQNGTRASFMPAPGQTWTLKYIGEVPKAVLIGHIGFIFATIFCIALAAMMSLPLISGNPDAGPASILFAGATLFTFIGGYPFGFAMNWYAFGVVWEGVPFGTDATDNKTQLLLVYLLFTTLISLGSLTRGKLTRDMFGPRAIGWFGLGSLLLALWIYAIPHSIQFSAALTYGFCYSFIAFWAVVYLYGYYTSRPKLGSKK
jgi:hypothetical protein